MASYTAESVDFGFLLDYSVHNAPPTTPRDPLLDITLDLNTRDEFGNPRYIVFNLELFPDGTDATFIDVDSIDFAVSLAFTDVVESEPFEVDAIDFNLQLFGDYVVGLGEFARVRWSKIGEFDFTKDRTNLAGDTPMDWRGSVYAILKLGKQVVVYGSGGVTRLTPHGQAWGKQLISTIGVMTEWSVTGINRMHFFINHKGVLCKVTDKVEPLGYEEYLSDMTYAHMFIDKRERLLYIVDGPYAAPGMVGDGLGPLGDGPAALSYVYDIDNDSMGRGPGVTGDDGNFTGIGYFDAIRMIAASADNDEISYPQPYITTDLLDFGTRKDKTVLKVEAEFVSTDTDYALNVSLSSRCNVYDSTTFVTTPTYDIGRDGIADVRLFGKEFKVNLWHDDEDSAEDFELNWIKIHGIIHDYDPRDS